MKTEELRGEEKLDFDAHEFDGLRDALEHEAHGIIAHVDRFVRANPLMCMAIAVAAGCAVGMAFGKPRKGESAGPMTDSRLM